MSHVFHLEQTPPSITGEGGSKTIVTKKNFPKLSGISLAKLHLEPLGIREPHWHANADELGYCLSGSVLVSFYATGNLRTKFLVKKGETFFIPNGTLHAIENVNPSPAELILQFNNAEPEDFALSSTMGLFSNNVLGNTWNVKADIFKDYKRNLEPIFATLAKKAPEILEAYEFTSPYRYNLANSPKTTSNEGGSAQVARNNVWPILKRQSLYNLILTDKGMREPHWHPYTAELGFVAEGKGRMSLLLPDGSVDKYELNVGDIYYIPAAYPHHIENLTAGKLHFLIFFDESMPGDIGLSGSVKFFPDALLESTLKAPEGLFSQLPTYSENRFIVEIVNPLD